MIRCRDPRRSETPPVGRAHRAALVALVAFLLAAPPVRGDDAADGRRHAQRASHLAAAGKCRQAIAEFDKAIAVLHDPTLLFNRGECHRKLGDADSALEDYHQFLSDLPNAPNRAQVEARIGELRDGKNKGKERKPAATTTVPPPVAPPVEAGGSSDAVAAPGVDRRARATARATERATERATARATENSPFPAAVGPVGPGSGSISATSPAPAADRPEEGTRASAGATAPVVPESPSRGDTLASRPWFWVALAAVVVGTGVGAYFALGRDPTNVPRSDLGNYRF